MSRPPKYHPDPPRLATRFLCWYCRRDLVDEVEGDLYELFQRRAEEQGIWKAKALYWLNVLMFLHPDYIRKRQHYPINHTAMLRHNFIISFRSFQRHKITFLINLIGLSSGLACALLIYLWVNDELSVDKFHEKGSQLYQVMEHQHRSSGNVVMENTPGILAEEMAKELPEVQYAATASWSEDLTLSVDDKNIKATGQYVGQDFFKIFSYNLIQGSENQVLSDKSSIVISEELALKLFNTTENIIGKFIELQHEKQYQVSGIFEGTPANSSEQFDFVLSLEEFKEKNPWALEWGNNGPRTFVVLNEDIHADQFNSKISDILHSKTQDTSITLFIKPFSERYLYGNYENGVQAGGRIEYVRLFSIIAIFILIIACINFMNLSTAKASRRLKEVGVKKAIGAGRNALIAQYISESLLMVFVSFVIAAFLVILFLPQFNIITGKQLTLEFDHELILTTLCIAFITGIMAGSYPAFYLSGFSPISIFRGGASGKFSASIGELWVRKGLVVFQFSLSVILIVSVLVIYKQIEYVQTKNLGYDKENIIYFPKVAENPETFLAEVNSIPGVVKASSIGHHLLGYNSSTGSLQWEGKNPDEKISIESVTVNYDMLELLGLEMKEGRSFSRNFSSDSTAIIFNEAAIAMMGLNDPVGKDVKLYGQSRQILGVVKDFHFTSLHEEVQPLFIVLAPEYTWNVMAKIEAGRERETIEQLQQIHQEYFPGFPFDYQFLDAEYQRLYAAELRVSTLSKYFAGLTILISCLGLFGLAAFTAERRLKEIGVRKILGSGDLAIVYLLSQDFTKMVLVAIGIALPISYFLAIRWLENFAFSVSLEWWYFAGAGIAALLIAWISVSFQTIKAARVNPVECLKDE